MQASDFVKLEQLLARRSDIAAEKVAVAAGALRDAERARDEAKRLVEAERQGFEQKRAANVAQLLSDRADTVRLVRIALQYRIVEDELRAVEARAAECDRLVDERRAAWLEAQRQLAACHRRARKVTLTVERLQEDEAVLAQSA